MANRETQDQLVWIQKDANEAVNLKNGVRQLLPMTPLGPDWMALSPGGLQARQIAQMTQVISWQYTKIQYRTRYVTILNHSRLP